MTSARRSILFVLPSLSGGGAERVIVSILRGVDRTRWNPALLLIANEPGVWEQDLPKDVLVLRIGATRARRSCVAILRVIWALRPEVVFVTIDHMNVLMGLLRPLMPRHTRLVLRVTDFGSLNSLRMRWMLGLALRFSSLTVYQSEAMEAIFRRALRIGKRHRGRVIRNAVSLDLIKKAAAGETAGLSSQTSGKCINLVAAGRLVEAKGFDLLIEALLRLNDPRLQLAILGEGPAKSQLSSLIARSGLDEQVRLCGFQANPYAWFRRADIFVLSSRSEGFPNVVLEALACGTPVIATPLPGLEGVPGVMLTDDISAAAIAKSLAEWIGSQPHAPTARVAAWLAAHDVPAVVSRYEEAFYAANSNNMEH